MVEVVRKLQSC